MPERSAQLEAEGPKMAEVEAKEVLVSSCTGRGLSLPGSDRNNRRPRAGMEQRLLRTASR